MGAGDVATTLAGVKPMEWATVLLALVAIVLSVMALARSISSERRVRKANLNLRRHEAFTLAVAARMQTLVARREMQALEFDALAAGIPEITSEAAECIADHDRQLARIDAIRDELAKELPTGRKARALKEQTDRHILELRQVATHGLLEDEGRLFIDPARLNIRLRQSQA